MAEERCARCNKPLYSTAVTTFDLAGREIRTCGFRCTRLVSHEVTHAPDGQRSATHRTGLAQPTLAGLLLARKKIAPFL